MTKNNYAVEISTRLEGLNDKEAEKLLEKFGLNEIESKKQISAFKLFLSQFNDFIIWVLIGATLLSGFMGEKADAITILIIVVMNAILGFIQEYKTEKSLEALKELAAPTAKVIRNGKIKIMKAEYLVPGDVVIFEIGDRIPADCIIIEESNLLIDESLLTGESVGVSKSSNSNNNLIYMGTTVLRGKAKAKVIDTGMNTEMGKIANMLNNIEVEKSPLKQRLASLGKILVVACIAICVVVTLLGIIRGQDKYQMFLVGVSLAVAAIPEGLPAIVTVSLALGVSGMLKRNALIRKLPAVETLGCTSVICSDKTGTLTENNMKVRKVLYNNEIYTDFSTFNNANKLLKAFTYCNDINFDFKYNKIEKCLFGDPTETALVKAFFYEKNRLINFLKDIKRVYDIPFDSTRKMMSVIVRENGKKICYVKGAPERIIERCKYILINDKIVPFEGRYRLNVLKQVDKMSSEALRCIAAAYKIDNLVNNSSIERDLIFIGVAGMIDPPRKEAFNAVQKCATAGIKVIMITGDHRNTAFAVGKELNICSSSNEVMTGSELDNLNDKELRKIVDRIRVFARVSPKHKLRIVKALKKKGYVVSMTGDGVNDAPAVKEADIGISMGISGTDVTKEASSMILLDDNFATIVSAVEEGRVIYDNIRKFIRYLLSCNLGEVLTMFLSSLFYLETPLLPIQILFVNLATDGLPALALGIDPPEDDVMVRKPREKDESIFANRLSEKIVIRGTLIGICTIFTFLVGKYYGMSIETCRTLALGTLIMSQLLHVFECRSEKCSIFQIKLFTNMYLVGAVLVSIIMLLLIIYVPFLRMVFHTVPLNIGHWLIIVFFSSVVAFANGLYIFLTHKN
ncbi:calcium-transporting ATPase [Clostridium tepidiprofundi DSM 19306]|uniref:P-type Ca(2+) transporter n=1 Tax=Clostridium tepidiprofundi DSM 19306 TaxID=1121338 RepID=A0A151B6S8_9CLOT|nr:calcium-translocating P-type ATPase, SERCA-type [Clostridium tepidiprofundi]KYH35625.1 calcium-transporting ATPase [Clostridium tepidiprofundi DSM 19306]